MYSDPRLIPGATATYRHELDGTVNLYQGTDTPYPVMTERDRKAGEQLSNVAAIYHTMGDFIIALQEDGTLWQIDRDHIARTPTESALSAYLFHTSRSVTDTTSRAITNPPDSPVDPPLAYIDDLGAEVDLSDLTRRRETLAALQAVIRERNSQDRRWGKQRHSMAIWLTVLSEEVGEASKDLLKLRTCPVDMENARGQYIRDLEIEVTQIAAVAVAWLEHIRDARESGSIMPGEVWE